MRRILLAAVSGLAIATTAPSRAADAIVEVVPEPVAAGYSWTGAYVGGFVGYGWGSSDDGSRLCPNTDPREEGANVSPPLNEPQTVGGASTTVGPNDFGLPLDLAGLSPAYTCRPFETFPANNNNDGVGVFTDDISDDGNDGFAWGGFVGVNKQYGKFVFGAELEGVALDSEEQTRSFNFAYFENTDPLNDLRFIGGGAWTTEGPDWMAQGTVKAGWLFGSMDQALVYVKGGFAVGDKMAMRFDGGFTDDCADCGGVAGLSGSGGGDTDSGYGFGGTIGGGLEYKFTENFSISGEYQYTHLDYSGESRATVSMVRDIANRDTREVAFTNTFEDEDIHMLKLKATWHFN
jgi:opacity protein-like surface antigen